MLKSCFLATVEASDLIEAMPRRIYVTLPDTVYASVERWAKVRGQPLATVAAIAIELATREAERTGEIPPADSMKEDAK